MDNTCINTAKGIKKPAIKTYGYLSASNGNKGVELP